MDRSSEESGLFDSKFVIRSALPGYATNLTPPPRGASKVLFAIAVLALSLLAWGLADFTFQTLLVGETTAASRLSTPYRKPEFWPEVIAQPPRGPTLRSAPLPPLTDTPPSPRLLLPDADATAAAFPWAMLQHVRPRHWGLAPLAALLFYVRFRGPTTRRGLVLGPKKSFRRVALFASSSKKSPPVSESTELSLSTNGDLRRVAVCVTLALLAAVGVFLTSGVDAGSEFLAAYLVEYSLSVDNLFVFLIIFRYFKTEPENQTRVLNFGLITAAVLRFLFLFIGEGLLRKFSWAILFFAAVLLFSSFKILTKAEEDEEEDDDLSDNAIVKFVQSFLKVSPDYDGNRFFTTVDGKRMATPLLLVLAVIELSDIVFATDSVPAVLGTTQDLTLAYTSNLFAILGLRSLYFVLADSLGDFKYLEPAVGAVLGFIGLKIVLDFLGVAVPTLLSLSVVAGLLGAGVLLSLNDPWAEEEQK